MCKNAEFVIFISACFTLSSFTIAYGQWNVEIIGTCPDKNLEEVAVADGRNDGTLRVYVATRQGSVYEWTYTQNTWVSKQIYKQQTLTALIVGDARNENMNSVYVGEHIFNTSGMCNEISFSSNTWNFLTVGQMGNVLSVEIGDARNDGTNRLYTAGQYFGLSEFTRKQTQWEKKTISTSITGGTIDIGAGKNDRVRRLYVPDRMGPLYEYSWSGTAFQQEKITLQTQMLAAHVGPGRSDGVNRVYTAKENEHLYEASYESGTRQWQVIDLTPAGPDKSHYGIIVGKTRRDGKHRVYATTQTGALYEYNWDGSHFIDSIVLDASTGATACLALGAGRNDDTARLYATNYSAGNVYEATHVFPWVNSQTEVVMESKQMHIPESDCSVYFCGMDIVVHMPMRNTIFAGLKKVHFSFYDLLGKHVRSLDMPVNETGRFRIPRREIVDGTSSAGRGVLLVKIAFNGFEFNKRFIITG